MQSFYIHNLYQSRIKYDFGMAIAERERALTARTRGEIIIFFRKFQRAAALL